METRQLGTSGIAVPVIGMGTWQSLDVRGEGNERDRIAVVDTAIAAGTTLFDTSPMYGESERVLSLAVHERRESLVIADKIWTSSMAEAAEQVRRALAWYDGVVDIYQVHNLVAWREHLPVLEALRDRGAVRVIGATHYQHSAFRELMEVMRTGRIQMIQVPYNAVDRVVEREVLPLAQELGLGVMVMQPLGTDRLARRVTSASELVPLAAFGVTTWAQALLKWIVSDPRVHVAIPATRHAARAAENAGAGTGPMFDADMRDYVARLAAS